MSSDTIEHYQDNAGEWRWRIKAPNGEIIAAATEGFVDRPGSARNLERVAASLQPQAREIIRLRDVISTLEGEISMLMRAANDGHPQVPLPIIRCHQCDAPMVDMDGFGLLACPRDPAGCFCSHPSWTDNVCGICGKRSGA